MIKMENSKEKAKAYALKNAIAHHGKATPGPVISSLFNEGLKKEDMKEFGKEINEIINKVNEMSLEDQKKEFEGLKDSVSEREVREGLPELPDASNGVVMRFAPSPSGALHIGHALTACLSFDYVKKYGGKFFVRIEDTNPENIYSKAYGLIKKDSDWLFEGEAEIVIQSDRIDLYYKYAQELVEKEAAYVCTCDSADFKNFVELKENCPCRNNDLEENKMRWEKMLNEYKEGEAVLRFKSFNGMQDPNPAMRDFPLARINENKHPRQGKKYKVWPLMNLAVTVDDIELGMTHVIRAKEHRDNSKRQKMIYEALGKKYPWVGFLGRIHLKGMKLSATEITEGVKEGRYSGWDDSELLTVASLKNKGYKPEAFWKLAEHIGLSENDKTLEMKDLFELLDTFNKLKDT